MSNHEKELHQQLKMRFELSTNVPPRGMHHSTILSENGYFLHFFRNTLPPSARCYVLNPSVVSDSLRHFGL